MTAEITVRFWAGAQRAAGHDEETQEAETIAELRQRLAARTELYAVLQSAAFLIDGQQAGENSRLYDGAVVDVLPPFAGGEK